MEKINQYLAYEEYVELGGTLEEMPFNLLEFKAQKKVDDATNNRLASLEEQKQDVKMCIYELIQAQVKYDKIGEGIKASESIDGYSVSYKETSQKELNKLYNNIIRWYLIECKLDDGTPYLYCGV